MGTIHISNKIMPSATMISNEFIDTYMAKASGEYVKVFLMVIRLAQSSEEISEQTIAGRLDMTERAVARALAYWVQEGLLSSGIASQAEAAPAREPSSAKDRTPKKPQLTPIDLQKKQNDQNFIHLKYIAEMYLGHPMTNPEVTSLIYIYDHLQLPVDLIEYLIEYCVSNHKSSLRYMEKVAIDWHKRGILTLQQAKTQAAKFGKDYYQIMKAMGLNNQPAPSQIEVMDKWLYKDCHSLNLILEACRRTITAIGKPSFPYASKILDSWKKAGIKSVAEIAEHDKQSNHQKTAQPLAAKKTATPNFEQRSYDFDALTQRYIEKINQ
jgi:DnaD/phage-associated family protein